MEVNINLLISILAFALSAIFALLSALVYRLSVKKNDKEIYEDRDGTATEVSRTTYSIRWQNVALTFISVSGFAISLAVALVQKSPRKEEKYLETWLLAGAWVLLALQRAQAFRTRQPVTFFRLTGVEAFTFLVIAASYTFALYSLFGSRAQHANVTTKVLLCTNLVLSVAGFATAITVPRRPAVFHNGRPVDGQWTVSLFSRYTYSWPSAFLERTKSGKKLSFDDFPALDHYTRARDLYDHFNAIAARGGSMLKHLILAFLPTLAAQYILALIDSLFMVAPQFAMYQLLRLLEARDAGADISTQATFWVIGLGLFIIAAGFFSNWMWWINFAAINIPVLAQLSALIFAKAMRRKDVKGITGSEKRTVTMGGEEAVEGQPQAIPEKENNSDEDVEENLQKTRQGVINLIGVDTKRVSDFGTFNHMFFAAACRLTVSFVFLGKLVGWKALLSGIAVQLLFLPINIYFAKKYSNGQEVLMKLRDRKLAVLNEALNGIRQIKFAALERQWQKKILDVREDELKAIWNTFIYDTVLVGLWLTGPVVLSAAVILVYALLNGALPPSIAFTTISLLGQIEGTLSWLPELTTNMLDAYVSLNRISEYLKGLEKEQIHDQGNQITFHNATIAWPSESPSPESPEDTSGDRFTLQNLNISFPLGELSLISGRTGSGKSLLLAALLGEADLLSGSITMPVPPPPSDRHDSSANKDTWLLPTAKAFVAQQPWIENASFKENILFGLPFDESRYRAVLSACALEPDLAVLPDGEETEIGANGVNLSGGQRWRASLARALYSRAGILVLDDVFSAVDAHVGRVVYERGIRGTLCRGRTVVLVTHHVGLVRAGAAYEVRLGNDGTVEYAGAVREGVDEAVVDDEEEDESGKLNVRERAEILRRVSTKRSVATVRRLSEVNGAASGASRRRSSQQNGKPDMIDGGGHARDAKVQQPRKFVEEEKTESGRVKWRIYKQYLDACGGWPFWLVVCIGFGGYEALLLGRVSSKFSTNATFGANRMKSWILKLWTEQYEVEASSFRLQSWYSTTTFHAQAAERPIHFHQDRSSDAENLKFYLSMYLGFAATICIEGTLRYLWVFYGSVKASRRLFESLTHAVLRAPLRWLDTMPVGRVLNRFTADFNTTDSTQAYAIAFSLYNVMLLLGIIVAGMIVSPYVILVSMILLGLCTRYALYYIVTARETKRLESVAKSPIFEFFSQALAGVSTLRAFDKTESYIATMFERIDVHARTLYYQWLLNRWLSWRLNVVGAVFAVTVAGIVVSVPGMDASLGGFALGFTLQYTEAVTWVLRNLSNVELGMNATERIIEYAEIDTEDEGGMDAPATWPSEGTLVVEDLWVGYAPDLPPVLKGLSFRVRKNERIGVVGRTGAGKSSLTLALFRFLEARRGSILIDGLNVSTIKLHDLRSRLAIIPQDPVLFSGTVRSNLDPFDEHDDRELLDALERVHLIESAPPTSHASSSNLPSAERSASETPSGDTTPRGSKNPSLSLNTPISESGLNLSQGQRQLLCLARAIVSRPKIMVLDEATSAVDKATDVLIQRSIREEFRDATLIVIAHRLSTIADFDRLLVLDQGVAVEFDEPRRLLEREGVFRGMVESSGEREVLREIILGEE